MPRYATQNKAEYLAQYRANKSCFGGALLNGNAKGRRPFSSRRALHIVLRSSKARGKLSLQRVQHEQPIKQLVRRQAARFQLKIFRYANVGNHLHILVQPSRTGLAGFLRAISGLIARLVLRAERGKPRGIKFWDKRPFTRIVEWGRQFSRCADYIGKNVFESSGLNALMDAQKEWSQWHTERGRSPART